jgi:hypothetical protein
VAERSLVSYSTSGRVRERQSLIEDLGSALAGRRERLRATTRALDSQLGLLNPDMRANTAHGEAAAVAFRPRPSPILATDLGRSGVGRPACRRPESSVSCDRPESHGYRLVCSRRRTQFGNDPAGSKDIHWTNISEAIAGPDPRQPT